MTTTPALIFDSVCYDYRSAWTGRRTAGLTNISLQIDPGEAFGFLGHNGAGKTTAIKCLLDLVRLKSGRIQISGMPHHRPVSRQFIGYVPEQPYFYDNLRVGELMELYATLAGLAPGDRGSAIDEALERVHLGPRRQAPIRTLSKGLMQRVALAQAIVHKPRLLILDEPFSGLDPIGRREFRDIFADLKSSGTTIFMSSHILSDVEFLCDRVSILARGELKGVFRVSEIQREVGGVYELVVVSDREPSLPGQSPRREGTRWCYSFPERTPAEAALRAALHKELIVESFQYQPGNLEDLFVKLVSFEEASGR